MVKTLVPARRRESWLSYFGPLSLLLLLSVWAGGLIIGFALIHWALGSVVLTMDGGVGFLSDLYLSGTTFSPLGWETSSPALPWLACWWSSNREWDSPFSPW